MRFYRNIGGITYQSETNSLQIFQAHPHTTIFQPKQHQEFSFLQQIATLHSQTLHCELHCYSQPGKGQSLILLNSRRPNLKNIDTQTLCSILSEAASMIKRISQFLSNVYGQCTIHNFRIVNQKLIFIYIPLTKVQNQNALPQKRVEQLLTLSKTLINIKNTSQKLLLKKLQKCKQIDQFIEEVKYFSSVYCISKNHINQIPQKPFLGNHHQKYHNKNKSHRKGSLFKLDVSKHQKYHHSSLHIGRNKNYLSQHREGGSSIMYMSSSHDKSLQTCQQSHRRMNASQSVPAKKESPSKSKKNILSNSRISEQSNKPKINKKQHKPRISLCTPISLLDTKLLQKLRNKKTLQNKIQKQKVHQIEEEAQQKHSLKAVLEAVLHEKQKDQFRSIQRNKQKIDQLNSAHNSRGVQHSRQIKELLSSTSTDNLNVDIVQLKQQEFIHQKPIDITPPSSIKSMKTIKEERQSFVSEVNSSQNKSHNQSFQKLKSSQPPRLSQQSTLIQKSLSQVQQISKQLPHSQINRQQPQTLVKKPLKKKTINYDEFQDELEVIQFNNKSKCSKDMPKIVQQSISPASKIDKQNSYERKQQFGQTQKKEWNKKINKSNFEETEKSSLNNALKNEIVAKFNKLNLMGSAVANTTTYLAKYDKIFWQLPMYFIYRGFYMKRLQIEKEVQTFPQKVQSQLKQIKQGNDKIQLLIQKLIKKVNIKLKKQSKNHHQTLKKYLTLQKQISCDQIMKGYLKVYIQSLSKSADKDQNLMHHLLQIIDAYLIYCGEQIDQQNRNHAKKTDQGRKKYITEQTDKLNHYY